MDSPSKVKLSNGNGRNSRKNSFYTINDVMLQTVMSPPLPSTELITKDVINLI